MHATGSSRRSQVQELSRAPTISTAGVPSLLLCGDVWVRSPGVLLGNTRTVGDDTDT